MSSKPALLDHPGGLLRLARLLGDSYQYDASWPDGQWPLRGLLEPPSWEIAAGAVLTQNTRWENVEIVLGRLEEAQWRTAGDLLLADLGLIHQAIRPAGFFRQKSRALRGLARIWCALSDGTPSREELLAIPGIGQETADAILLYAFDLPEFVADLYTRRLICRLGITSRVEGYGMVKTRFEKELPRSVQLYRRLHALIVRHGKMHCRARTLCRGCPLQIHCPSAAPEIAVSANRVTARPN